MADMTAPLATPIPTVPLNDGHSIPQLGLGTWPMSDADAPEAVSTALEMGYRQVDTAAKYENEVGVGRGLAASGMARDELYVVTKLRGSEQGYESAKTALEGSLERLGLDYVDLYLIHWPLPRLDKYVDSYRAMVELKEQGRIRSVGVSNFTRGARSGGSTVSSTIPRWGRSPRSTSAHPRRSCSAGRCSRAS
jgi:2,5-diketo-D-gluconate reductase A